MIELWFVCAVGILSLLSTIISSKGSLFDNRYKWHKRLTKRGQLVSLIGLTIVILSIWQYVIIKNKDARKDALQLQQVKTSDSTISAEIKKGVDSNRHKLFNDLSEAFAKQNLKIDTITKKIEILRDSTKTVFMTTPKESPIIIVRVDGMTHLKKKDTLTLTLSLISIQAPASLIKLNYLCEINYSDGSQSHTKESNLLKGTILMPKDERMTHDFDIYTDKQVNYVDIALLGTYRSTENKKELLLKDIYRYSLATKQIGFLSGNEKKIFFEKYKIK